MDRLQPQEGGMVPVRPQGFKAFIVICVGQLISMTGTAMTSFALSIWAWKMTGSATALAVVAFFNYAPMMLMSPIAGVLVDRWNRKVTMALSDIASGFATVVVLILYLTGHLQIWHLCVTGAFSGFFQAFQWPAYSASISAMMPKDQYGRASGMFSLVDSTAGIFAPIAAGAIVAFWGPAPVFVIDIATFCIAVASLLFVHIPDPAKSSVGEPETGSLLRQSLFGFRYILARRPLTGLLLIFFAANLVTSICMTIWNPMILARTSDNARILGLVSTVSAVGGLVGGLLMSSWGGPKHRMRGLLGSMVWVAVIGLMLMGLTKYLWVWLVAGFLGSFIIPILNGCNDVIWQLKIPHDVQGRVFASRRMIAQTAVPVAMLSAGPLADFLFEPGMMPGAWLARSFGSLIGTGQGSGMALMFVLCGLLLLGVTAAGYLIPTVRDVERLIPDYEASSDTVRDGA